MADRWTRRRAGLVSSQSAGQYAQGACRMPMVAYEAKPPASMCGKQRQGVRLRSPNGTDSTTVRRIVIARRSCTC